MIELSDHNGAKLWLQPSEILEISDAGASQKWHGIRANVRTPKGWREVRESPEAILGKMKDET